MKLSRWLLTGFLLAGLALAAVAVAADPMAEPRLTVTGAVKQPLSLGLAELTALAQIEVKQNDIRLNGEFRGAFRLRGVPLKTLLDLAQVGKEAGGFGKAVDLAIAVRDRAGNQVALSWGEVYHRNPAEVVLALAASPVRPKKSCTPCHDADFAQPWLAPLERTIAMPKLVVTGDQFSDRSLEGVIAIEVRALPGGEWGPKPAELYSPGFDLKVGKLAPKFERLPDLARVEVLADQVGDGKGFHGRRRYQGVALAELIERYGQGGGPRTVYLLSAPDGYRSLVSWGELFLNPLGRRILVAEASDGQPIAEAGRFQCILPDDLWADRWVKALGAVQAVDLDRPAQLYVIGVGPGDGRLLTLQTLAALAKVDVLVAPADIQKRFAHYLGGKPVLLDPFDFDKKPLDHGDSGEAKKPHPFTKAERERAAGLIRAQLAAGKSVAVLDWGDPMVYGSWRWLKGVFDPGQITFVPSMSSFSAASAALGRDVTCHGAVVLSDGLTLQKEPEMVRALAGKGATLAVFMGLPKLKDLVPALLKAYPPETPAAVVFKAGFTGGEKVVRTRLDRAEEEIGRQKEGWLGIIYVGPCLD